MAAPASVSAKFAANSSCSALPSPAISSLNRASASANWPGLRRAIVATIWASERTGAVGVLGQVAWRDRLVLGEPVVLDHLVEEGHVGLVEVVGLGVLRRGIRQVADQGPVVRGLDRRRRSAVGAAVRRSHGPSRGDRAGRQGGKERSAQIGVPVRLHRAFSSVGNAVRHEPALRTARPVVSRARDHDSVATGRSH